MPATHGNIVVPSAILAITRAPTRRRGPSVLLVRVPAREGRAGLLSQFLTTRTMLLVGVGSCRIGGRWTLRKTLSLIPSPTTDRQYKGIRIRRRIDTSFSDSPTPCHISISDTLHFLTNSALLFWLGWSCRVFRCFCAFELIYM